MTVVAVFIVGGLILAVIIFRERFRAVYIEGKRAPLRAPRNLYLGLSVLTLALAVVESVAFARDNELRALVLALGAWITTGYFWWSAWRAA